MTQTAPLTGMVAVSGDSDIQVLGYVTWFSVPDRAAQLRVLRYEWKLAGLDENLLPPEPRPLYLFKRAMRSQAGKVRGEDGNITETDVRLVQEDHDLCVYQISRVVRDVDKRVVNYPKAMRVTFDKNEPNAERPFGFDPLNEVDPNECIDLMEGIVDYYERESKQIDGRKIRALVRDYIKGDPDPQRGIAGLRGLNMRGKAGGVYFVLAEHKATLDKIAQVLAGVYPDGSAYLEGVPMADGRSERELVRRKHIAESLDDAKDALSDVRDLLLDRTEPIRADVAQHHWRRLQTLRERVAEYGGRLESESGEVNDALDLLKGQLERLI